MDKIILDLTDIIVPLMVAVEYFSQEELKDFIPQLEQEIKDNVGRGWPIKNRTMLLNRMKERLRDEKTI